MTDDPLAFVDTVLLDAVVRPIQSQPHVQIVNSLEQEQKCKQKLRRSSSGSSLMGGSSGTCSDLLQLQQARFGEDSSNTSSSNQSSLYLIVDRLMPTAESSSTDSSSNTTSYHHQQQETKEQEEDRAERLARAVAAHPVLRTALEGITVGLSNHPRAAPALEACVDAVTVGAPERRRHCGSTTATATTTTVTASTNMDNSDNSHHNLDPQKSLLGIVALDPGELLGLQDASVTDAAQGVWQAKVTAEWNGNGNLTSFAQRAHRQWCRRNGFVPAYSNAEVDAQARQRKLPKRLPRALRLPGQNHRPPRPRHGALFMGGDVLAVAWLLTYIVFHFFREEFVAWVNRVVAQNR